VRATSEYKSTLSWLVSSGRAGSASKLLALRHVTSSQQGSLWWPSFVMWRRENWYALMFWRIFLPPFSVWSGGWCVTVKFSVCYNIQQRCLEFRRIVVSNEDWRNKWWTDTYSARDDRGLWPVLSRLMYGLTEQHLDNLRPDSWLTDRELNTLTQEYKAAILNPPL